VDSQAANRRKGPFPVQGAGLLLFVGGIATEAEVDLNDIRDKLDEVDSALVQALAERQRLVNEVGRWKAGGGAPLRDHRREEDVLTRVVERSREAGLDPFFATRLFREILGQSLRQQVASLGPERSPDGATVRVGYQGTEGAYSEMAAKRHFGPGGAEVSYRGYDTFQEMLEEVHAGGLDYAMLPIENTTSGSVTPAYDLLSQMDLALVGEEVVEVDHCLLALEDVPISRIRRIYSHPVALSQCGRFLGSLRDCHVEAFTDTAMAARRIRDEQDLSQAAIASEEAARLYGLAVLKRGVQDQPENYTRMVVVARKAETFDRTIPCKTSLMFATRHEEGALLRCLSVLAERHLSMTKLESRPRPRNPWEYLFYVDFEGNLADPNVSEAVRALAACTSYLRVLGSFPARTVVETGQVAPRPQTSAAPRATPDASDAPKSPSPVVVLEKKAYTLASRAHRPEDSIIHVAGVALGGSRPVVIAGPCSVESRDQIRRCARVVKECGGQVLRGGCFKPRTSPYSFQGLGYEALDLLVEAGAEFGLPVITEVMHPADVGPVAQKAHILQVGARNMQNFSLLKEVGRVDRPVLLKRGLMSSIDEWLGAAEYVLAQGNQMVILCERGIRTFEMATRNTLDLGVVPVVKELSHLPVFVDPSHGLGVARWVPPMVEAAIAAGAHGVMIEIHPDPETALSDGPQSLTFEMFESLMKKIG
jgi:chorismate mutase / prephenate dehydratase